MLSLIWTFSLITILKIPLCYISLRFVIIFGTYIVYIKHLPELHSFSFTYRLFRIKGKCRLDMQYFSP
jgi:hypothetical protein